MSTDMGLRAVQAFWAMHVEAMSWGGTSVRDYAAGLQLSPTSLRKWRDQFVNSEVENDWGAALHLSARPLLRTRLKDSAKDSAHKSALTEPEEVDSPPTRRSFAEEKLVIVLETEHAEKTVSSVARQHGIVTSMLFRWRVELGFGRGKSVKLASVRIADGQTAAVVLHDLLLPPEGMAATCDVLFPLSATA